MVLLIDNELAWHKKTSEIIKKAHSCIFCLRKLRSFRVFKVILQMFFLSTISSVITVGSVVVEGTLLKNRIGTDWKDHQKGWGCNWQTAGNFLLSLPQTT